MFVDAFAIAETICAIEDILEDSDRAILEWKDPAGLRGRGLFRIRDGKIRFQRGYWDKLTFLRLHGLPLEG